MQKDILKQIMLIEQNGMPHIDYLVFFEQMKAEDIERRVLCLSKYFFWKDYCFDPNFP